MLDYINSGVFGMAFFIPFIFISLFYGFWVKFEYVGIIILTQGIFALWLILYYFNGAGLKDGIFYSLSLLFFQVGIFYSLIPSYKKIYK